MRAFAQSAMKVLLALVVVVAAVAAAPREQFPVEETTAFDYHNRVGIPEAKRIRLAEEELAKDPSRIVGGSSSTLGQFPYQTGLLISLTSGGTSVCGGSLVSATRVVSAAHCWTDGRSTGRMVTVVLGSVTLFTGGTRRDSSAFATHASYNPNTIANDVGIITIAAVTFTNNLQAIALPSGNQVSNTFAGVTAVASGFGRTSDSQSGIPNGQTMSFVNLPVITNAVCRQTFGTIIMDSTLCTSGANGRGTCGGDSGGPLAVPVGTSRILVGITSFGSARGCSVGAPSAFARVTSFLSWIQQRM